MNKIVRWFPLILVATGILAYANSFSAPFILDDARVITGNPNIHTLWPPWKAVYVPTRWVADISFAINLAISGFTPADFRITNILIHITAGLFLFGVIRRTLLLPRFNGRFEHHASWVALTTALLWIAHPLQTGCVTYIAQRIEALMGMFFLATLYCFIRAVSSPSPRLWTNLTIAVCAIGMGTKEVMVTAPILILIYDGILASPSWREALRSRWKTHLALFLTIGILALLLLMGIGIATGQGVTLVTLRISPWRYLLTQTEVITHYLRLSFVPTSLCLNYNWPMANGLADVWPSACFITTLGAITLLGLLSRKAFAFPLVWMFIILAPTSSILPIADAAFEHRMYLPLAGVLVLTAVGGHSLWRRFSNKIARRDLVHAVAIVLIAAPTVWFISLTALRNTDYLSTEAMWKDVIKKRPDSPRGYISLSQSLIHQGEDKAAIRILSDALSRLPDLSKISYEEIRQQWNAGKYIPYLDYADIHNLLGVANLNSGNTNAAISNFMESMRISPYRPMSYLNIGRIAMAQKKYQEATMWIRFAHQYAPNNEDTLCMLASLMAIQKNWPAAAKYFEKPLKLNPTLGFARAQLAWILATCPDASVRNGPKAVEWALPLIPMSEGISARAHDILAAAYAEAGDFDKAIQHAEISLKLFPKSAEPVISEESSSTQSSPQEFSEKTVSRRMNLYKQGIPYHETP
jgi:tetratricopeptide (TPR) repeat protein